MNRTYWRMKPTIRPNATKKVPIPLGMPFDRSGQSSTRSKRIATKQWKCWTKIRKPICQWSLWYTINIPCFPTNFQECSNSWKACEMTTWGQLKRGSTKMNPAERTVEPSIIYLFMPSQRREDSKNKKSIRWSPWKSLNPPKCKGRPQWYSCLNWIARSASVSIIGNWTQWQVATHNQYCVLTNVSTPLAMQRSSRR